VEADQARAIVEHFTAQIQRAVRSEIPRPVFIRSDLVNSWGRQAINDATGTEHKGLPIQLIRNLAKAGFLPMVDRDMKRWPPGSSHARVAGIAWGFDETTEQATVISKDAEGGIKTTVMP
jgi:hypothetical protein